MRVCTGAALGGRHPASRSTRKTASRGSQENFGLSAYSRRSRLAIPLAHINGPEQYLAFRHQARERMAQLQRPYQYSIVAVRAASCVPTNLGTPFSRPHTAKYFHTRPPSPDAIIGDPAAAAIQNSRLYERAEIFGSELQRRLTDLRQTEKALEQSEEGRRVSEDKFQKVFRSTLCRFSRSRRPADHTFVKSPDANPTPGPELFPISSSSRSLSTKPCNQ